MAKFCDRLNQRGIAWPDNLVAMTSVTSGSTLRRIDQLRKVNCRFRALSVEPLWESVRMNLDGIDWVIVGGESSCDDHEFDLQWAREIRDQCRQEGDAFFLKQLGSLPVDHGQSLKLMDRRGGDWDEGLKDLCVREFPAAFAALGTAPAPKKRTRGRKSSRRSDTAF